MATKFSMETTPTAGSPPATATTPTTTYEFKSTRSGSGGGGGGRTRKYSSEHHTTSDHHSHHSHFGGGGGDEGSLTYSSAASSINSAAESTDSSFADIMKVLDGPESTREIAMYLQHKEAAAAAATAARRQDERSVAESSLAYSTDAESMMRSLVTEGESTALQGADYISTMTGYVFCVCVCQRICMMCMCILYARTV